MIQVQADSSDQTMLKVLTELNVNSHWRLEIMQKKKSSKRFLLEACLKPQIIKIIRNGMYESCFCPSNYMKTGHRRTSLGLEK